MSGLPQAWYDGSFWPRLLYPLSLLFAAVAARKRRTFLNDPDSSWLPPVPLIVVGNITVGGTGKTPVVVWLAALLRDAGLRPGIVSRGYGGKPPQWPLSVQADTPVDHCGDEPLMLALRTGCPLVVAPDRPAAVRHLLAAHECDIVIADDGLQHYALGRSLEIVVVDGERGLGNGLCLPAGPLREPASRLETVDLVLSNGPLRMPLPVASFQMQLMPGELIPMGQADQPPRGRVHAVAGIGNPQRFFQTLSSLGLDPVCHGFPDHHAYTQQDLQFGDSLPVVMTEKDAVKCRDLDLHQAWYLPVDAQPETGFTEALCGQLNLKADTQVNR